VTGANGSPLGTSARAAAGNPPELKCAKADVPTTAGHRAPVSAPTATTPPQTTGDPRQEPRAVPAPAPAAPPPSRARTATLPAVEVVMDIGSTEPGGGPASPTSPPTPGETGPTPRHEIGDPALLGASSRAVVQQHQENDRSVAAAFDAAPQDGPTLLQRLEIGTERFTSSVLDHRTARPG
jgi:hypothetical protein